MLGFVVGYSDIWIGKKQFSFSFVKTLRGKEFYTYFKKYVGSNRVLKNKSIFRVYCCEKTKKYYFYMIGHTSLYRNEDLISEVIEDLTERMDKRAKRLLKANPILLKDLVEK